MSSIQQLVDQLNAQDPTHAWKLLDPKAKPFEQTTVKTEPSATPGLPGATTNVGTGNYLVIVQDNEGHTRALPIKADPIKGGLVLRQSGVNDQGDDAKNIYDGDLNSLSWHAAGALTDVPAGQRQPSKAEDLQKIGPDGQVIPAGNTTTKPVDLYDPKTGNHFAIPQGTQPALHEFGNDLLLVQPDGTFSVITTKEDKPTTTNVPGIGVVTVDPSKPIGSRVTVELPEDKNAKASQFQPREINGQMWIAVDQPGGGVTWQVAKDSDGNPLPTNVTWSAVANDPRSPTIQLIGSNGETKFVSKGPDWKPPPSANAGQAVTPDTVAPYVVTIGDNGQPVFTPNQNQVTMTEATRQFIDSMGIHLAQGSMSESQAQDLIKNVTAQMAARAQQLNAQANVLSGATTAAGDILTGVHAGAQTGAGLLTNRVSNAMGMVQNLTGLAAGAKNLMSVPAELGENLVQGAAGWATELGGGQGVYDAAANMVKAADPTNSSGLASQGYAALQQMLKQYQDLTGQMHPAAAAAQGNLGATGFTSPGGLTNVTPNSAATAANAPNQFGFNPQASTAALNAAGFQDTPEGRAAAIRAGRGDLLGLPSTPITPVVPTNTGSPYISYPNQVPGSNYGAATAFVAPTTVVPTPATVTA